MVNKVEKLGWQASTCEVLQTLKLLQIRYTIITFPVPPSLLPPSLPFSLPPSPTVIRNFSGLAQEVDHLIHSFGACNSSKYLVHVMFVYVCSEHHLVKYMYMPAYLH